MSNRITIEISPIRDSHNSFRSPMRFEIDGDQITLCLSGTEDNCGSREVTFASDALQLVINATKLNSSRS